MLKDIRDMRINQLLGAIEPASRKRISPHLEPIELKLGALVCEAGGLLKDAYFPQGSVLSLLTVLENGSAIETANIGREGAFGFSRPCTAGSLSIDAFVISWPHGSLSDRSGAI